MAKYVITKESAAKSKAIHDETYKGLEWCELCSCYQSKEFLYPYIDVMVCYDCISSLGRLIDND